MKKPTSRQAFKSVTESGFIGRLQKLVYAHLYNHGPGTAREIGRQMGLIGAWKRFSELERLNLVKESCVRKCRVSGREAIVWAVTSTLAPTHRPKRLKKPTRKELEAYVVDLECRLKYWIKRAKV